MCIHQSTQKSHSWCWMSLFQEKWKHLPTKTFMLMFITALFMIAKKLETTKWWLTGKWINHGTIKLWNTTQQEKRTRLLIHAKSEWSHRSVTEVKKSDSKATCSVIPFTWHFDRDKKKWQGQKVDQCGGDFFYKMVWGVLRHETDTLILCGYTVVYISQNSLKCTFQKGDFILCTLTQ